MALRAGYYGLKRALIEKVKVLPGFSAIGTGLQINNDGELEVTGATTTIDPNPEGDPTESLEKLQIGDTIYGVNDNTKCYQTDDDTEVTIVDADYVPFYDASASAPKKSTWSNFISKIKAKITEYVTWSFNARTGVHNILDPDFNPPSFSSVDDIVTLNNGILTLNGTRASSTNYAIKDSKTGAKVIYLPKGTYTYYALGADWENGVQVGTTYNNSFVSIAQSGSANDRVTFTVDDNTPSDFKLADGSVLIGLYVKILLGTYSNKVIKPMLCSGNDPIATYAPFAMTNRELTEKVNSIKYKTIPFTYTTSTIAGNVQPKEVTTGVNKADVLMISAETGGTNDSADVCAVRDGVVNIAITNLLGHASPSEITGTVFLIYKE